MTKPTFVFVPGAWHKPEIYSTVIKSLNEHGYPTVGLPLPSAGAMPPDMTFDEDVKAIRDTLTKLVDTEEKEVILVVHTYTGMPGAEAPEGLGKKDRQARGLKGGVVRLVFIMAFAMPEGFQPTASGQQMPEWMKLDMQVRSSPTIQSLGVYSSTQTHAAWRRIPSTYVIGERDKTTFTPQVVDMIINGAKQMEPSAFDVIERCDGGHCLMISRPYWLAGVLRKAAGEVLPDKPI